MCNLSQGILERGEARGEARGFAKGRTEGKREQAVSLMLSMHQKGYTLEQIADVLEKPLYEVEKTIRSAKEK